jgi:tRNA-specific 2-thiouridylase
MKIAVAMSGGVDSSVAAAILKRAGHEVFGITMQVLSPDFPGGDTAADRAGEVARRLGIPHHTVDLRNVFQELVIDDFCREYGRGRTPNPCIRCNRHIKFGALLDRAKELGADRLATGHYARVTPDETGNRLLLKKGADPAKDQSYVLYALTYEQLKQVMLPLGELTKTAVKKIARDTGIPLQSRPESQEICFIPGDDYAAFLEERLPGAARPGPIIDQLENVLGEHRGIIFYTVGQRQRLGIATGKRLYVTAIHADRNTIVAGPGDELFRQELLVSDLNWLTAEELRQPQDLKVKIRYRHREAAARVTPENGGQVRVSFYEPQPAVTPGQAAVFYSGDTVLGGGIIQ